MDESQERYHFLGDHSVATAPFGASSLAESSLEEQVAAIHSLPATFPAVADSLPRFDELLEGCRKGDCTMPPASDIPLRTLRSEEHTSELQSLMRISYAVFCLKKKKKK